jgi:hypothetical protein
VKVVNARLVRGKRTSRALQGGAAMSAGNLHDASWFVQRPPPQHPEADAREREQTAAAVRDALSALEVLVVRADALAAYLTSHWDLAAPGPPDLSDALAAYVVTTHALMCLGEVNRTLVAGRLRAAAPGAEEPPHA